MIRTRFAPSPTGYLHIGGLRTALFAYLTARSQKGKFYLRIEDTDQKRYTEDSMTNIFDALQTMGISWDEGPDKGGEFGPYIQSQRLEIYKKYALELEKSAAAYPCFCAQARLEQMRANQQASGLAPMYDRACLRLTHSEIAAKKAAGEPWVLRLKIPRGRTLKFKDLIHGNMQINTSTLDDLILMKSDGFPTYHLAHVIDDHLMATTHVIRGDEWLPSAPRHLLIFEAFGWQPPHYAHIPLILNKDKTKLSKRQGDVSVNSYLEKGYLPEAILNFAVLLGWHPGGAETNEIFTLQELEKKFTLEKVHKSGAIFDIEKLNWFNFQWQKKKHLENIAVIAKEIDPDVKIENGKKGDLVFTFLSPQKEEQFVQKRALILLSMCENHIPEAWKNEKHKLLHALLTVEEKILRTPALVASFIHFYFEEKALPLDILYNEKMSVDSTIAKLSLLESIKSLSKFNNFDSITHIHDHLVNLAQELSLKNGQLLWPLRVALTGEQFSPGTFELIWVLGKKDTISRLKNALDILN